MQRAKRHWPILFLLVIYTVFLLLQAPGQAAVTNVDYWHYLRQAEGLSLTRLNTWVHGFHPVGYLALLRLGLVLGADVARYGQLLSWLGSVVALLAVYTVLHRLTKRATFALAGVVLLSLHPFFRFQALQEGTDMLAAGLQLAALALMLAGEGRSRRSQLLWVGTAGVALGAAYLVRYTALTLGPVLMLYLWWRERENGRAALPPMSALAGAFVLVALPQLLASALVTGNPLYNEQARNVWFGLYGAFDWTANWQRIPPGITFAEILRADPAGFLAHWAGEFGRFLAYDPHSYAGDPLGLERRVTLWEPLANHVAWLAGSALLLVDRRLSRPQIALLLGALFFPAMAASMAWLFTRFLLVPLALQAVVIVLAVGHIGGRLASTERARMGAALVLLAVIVLLFLWGTSWGVKQERVRRVVQRLEEIQSVLAAVGIGRPEELLTNNRLVQDLDEPRHRPYTIMEPPGNGGVPVPTLLARITGGRPARYLLFDWTEDAIRTYALEPYRAELARAREQVAPLYATDQMALYCLVPCKVGEATAVEEGVTDALTLVGVRAFSSRGRQHGLYLYWRLNGTVSDGRPLSLTLRSEADEVVYQWVGHAQQGTYPMDRWPVGEIVVDYHPLTSEKVAPGRVYRLTVGVGGAASEQGTVTAQVRFEYP